MREVEHRTHGRCAYGGWVDVARIDVNATPFHSMEADAVLEALETNRKGLRATEVLSRLAHYGENKLEEPEKDPWWKKLLEQFRDPLMYLLMAASFIALIIHPDEPGDAIFIWLVLTANAFFGFWQEQQAEQAMEALKQMAVSNTVVLRDGVEREIPTNELVPGDVVHLEEGDRIPADLRLIEGYQFKVNESSLTGESEAIKKHVDPTEEDVLLHDRSSMAYMGTVASSGRGVGVICATGMSTELGKIASSIAEAETPKTPLELRLEDLGRFLGMVAIVIAVLLVGIKITLAVLGDASGAELRDVAIEQFIVAIAIFVAIVPEGLPIILVITLALGMRNMARHKAIVRRMKAVETLGSTTVICSDKTGTLTKNEMTVRAFLLGDQLYQVTGEGFDPSAGELTQEGEVLGGQTLSSLKDDLGFRLATACASLCHNSSLHREDGQWIAIGDPTDSACAVFGWKMTDPAEVMRERHPRHHEFFFDAARKRMTTVNVFDGGRWAFSKGAIGPYLPLVSHVVENGEIIPIEERHRQRIGDVNLQLASQALRVLALCARRLPEDVDQENMEDVENEFILLGLVGIMDPPRPEVFDAIKRCRQAGVRVVMITGDQQMTAIAISNELGIKTEDSLFMPGQELANLSDVELSARINDVSVFSRVTPEQKMRIVDQLQQKGNVVAMTGDGVNDAPALSKANIGIAMGIAGTDVAKDAADMVLQDDNFANIVAAVEEGRKIYQNIRNFVRYQVSTNVAAVLLIVLATFVFQWELPLTATQILVINILMDGPPAVALGVEKKHGKVMQEPPRPPTEGLPTGFDMLMIAFLGTVMTTGTLLLFFMAEGGIYAGATADSEPSVDDYTNPAYAGENNTFDQAAFNDWAEARFEEARTIAFATFVLFQLFNVLNCRSLSESVFTLGPFSNRAINLSIAICSGVLVLLIQTAGIELLGLPLGELLSVVPLELGDWVLIVVTASMVLWLEEFRKLLTRKPEPEAGEPTTAGAAESASPAAA